VGEREEVERKSGRERAGWWEMRYLAVVALGMIECPWWAWEGLGVVNKLSTRQRGPRARFCWSSHELPTEADGRCRGRVF